MLCGRFSARYQFIARLYVPLLMSSKSVQKIIEACVVCVCGASTHRELKRRPARSNERTSCSQHTNTLGEVSGNVGTPLHVQSTGVWRVAARTDPTAAGGREVIAMVIATL